MPSILENLRKNRANSATYDEVLQAIDEFSKEVEQFASELGGKVICIRESGFAVDYGQEWRVALYKGLPIGGGKVMDYSQILFRVYVPLTPFRPEPVRCDFNEEELSVCSSLEELKWELERFAGLPHVAETIQYLSTK